MTWSRKPWQGEILIICLMLESPWRLEITILMWILSLINSMRWCILWGSLVQKYECWIYRLWKHRHFWIMKYTYCIFFLSFSFSLISFHNNFVLFSFHNWKWFQVLINNGYAPEWVMLEKEIRQDRTRIREALLRERRRIGQLPLSPEDEVSLVKRIYSHKKNAFISRGCLYYYCITSFDTHICHYIFMVNVHGW